jgi:hypothetical protein
MDKKKGILFSEYRYVPKHSRIVGEISAKTASTHKLCKLIEGIMPANFDERCGCPGISGISEIPLGPPFEKGGRSHFAVMLL